MLFSHSFATIVLCTLTLPVSNALPVTSTSDYTTEVSSSDNSPIGADAYIPDSSSNANSSGTPADYTSYDCPSSSVPPDSHTPSNTTSNNSATVETSTAGTSFPDPPTCRKPATVVLDGQKLMYAKCRVKSGDLSLQSELNGLLYQAELWMTQGPWSVVNNLKSVPNGNSHDYASQAPYWWPNNWEDPDSGDVCPYVQRDGVFNPETNQYTSKADRLSMFEASYTLSLAWYHSDNSSYRVHAADILKTWFINEATAMNPNLAHSQLIPCANDGRSIGIIDFSLDYDDSWSQNDEAVFRQWNSDYLTWLTQSDFGKAEANIGTLLNVDLWNYCGPDGQSIKGAIDFLIPYATGSQVWPYEELNFLQYAASDVINAAADHNDQYAQSALPDIAYSPIGNQWSLRPSAEQLDNIVTTES
ncbi:hypothetical protein I350_06908 [Cryptococcus amylolentus CBS 6273]|uniref:Alginate lyase domain-containing protein n=1 Tax=Cryptococcus amylolentus CBS 6273 TaxID=1296118 RepID=A0A1E3JHG6_9TREE|nr:hypothetical protein I350_06908 [Cryptococcus amylolentus CBS 6273]